MVLLSTTQYQVGDSEEVILAKILIVLGIQYPGGGLGSSLAALLIALNSSSGTISPQAFAAAEQAYVATLPASDPHVVGEEWNNGGTRCISEG